MGTGEMGTTEANARFWQHKAEQASQPAPPITTEQGEVTQEFSVVDIERGIYESD